jgi:hypothetical protein
VGRVLEDAALMAADAAYKNAADKDSGRRKSDEEKNTTGIKKLIYAFG